MKAFILAALALLAPGAEARTIRFGLTTDYFYPPFALRAPDGTLGGADVETARRIAAGLGAEAEFVPTTWPTLAADFAAGRFDVAIGGLTVTPERAALGTFSIPLLDDGKRPLARCGEARRYRSVAAIERAAARVEVNRGPMVAELVRGWFRRAPVTVRDDDDLLPALLERRADVWITDGVVVDHMARRYRGRLCATTLKPFTHVRKAWLIRRDPALVREIDGGLARALRDGSWLSALRAVP